MAYINILGRNTHIPLTASKPNFVQEARGILTKRIIPDKQPVPQSKLTDFPDEVKQPKFRKQRSGMSESSLSLDGIISQLTQESDITYTPASQLKPSKPKPTPKPIAKPSPKPIPNTINPYKWHDRIDKTVVFLVSIVSTLSVVIPMILGVTVFIMLFMPYWLVGSVTDVQVPLTPAEIANLTSNYTINKTVVQQPAPSSPVVQVPSTPQVTTPPGTTVIQVPSTPTTTTPAPPPPVTPPVIPNTTITSLRNTTGIPSNLLFQTEYQCYWDLRDKGYGLYFEAESECNSHNTGLWQDACDCCRLMGKSC